MRKPICGAAVSVGAWAFTMVLVLGGAVAPPLASAAVATLDQIYVPSGYNGVPSLSAGFGSINTNQERAQSFTVGLDGTLTRVDVFIYRFSGSVGNLFCDVRPVDASGHPIDTNLASVTVPGIDVPAQPNQPNFFPLDLSATPVTVHAGDRLAVVLHASAGDLTFNWGGDEPGTYAGGAEQERVIGNHGWTFEFNGTADLGFASYVTVPEPAGTAIVAAGLAVFVGCRRRTDRRRDTKA